MSPEPGKGGIEMLGLEVPLGFSLCISMKKEHVLKYYPKYFNKNVYERSIRDLLFLVFLMRKESVRWTWIVFCHMICLSLHTNIPLATKLLQQDLLMET